MRPDNVVPLNSPESNLNSQDNDNGELFQGLLGESPACPENVAGRAKQHYLFLVSELKKAGLIAKIDQGALEILARAYAGMNEAADMMQENGEFQKTPNGYAQLSPWAVQYDRYSKQYEKLCVKFGITLAGRQRVKQDNPNQGALDL